MLIRLHVQALVPCIRPLAPSRVSVRKTIGACTGGLKTSVQDSWRRYQCMRQLALVLFLRPQARVIRFTRTGSLSVCTRPIAPWDR